MMWKLSFPVWLQFFLVWTAVLKKGMLSSAIGHYLFTEWPPLFCKGYTMELFHLFSPLKQKDCWSKKKQGFNFIQVWLRVFEWDKWKAWILPVPGSVAGADPLRPRCYFSGLTHLRVAKKTPYTGFGIFHAQTLRREELPPKRKKMALWISNRTQSSNIVWTCIHADSLSCLYSTDRPGIQEATEEDTHHYPSDPSPKSSSFLHPAPWLRLIHCRRGPRFHNYEMVIQDYKKVRKPVSTWSATKKRSRHFPGAQGGYWSCVRVDFIRTSPWKLEVP